MNNLKRILQIVSLGMAGLGSFHALAGDAGDSVKATPLSGEIQMDGSLDESAWASAPFYEIRRKLGGGEPDSKTKFQVLYDEYALYVGVVCAEPEMAQLKATATERDSGVYGDDCVELFINPNRKLETYAHFMVNALGTVYDARAEGANEQNTWNAQGIEAAAAKGKDQWSFELKIPFANFYSLYPSFDQRKAISGTLWSMNVVRTKRTQPTGISTYAALSELRDMTKYPDLAGLNLDFKKFLWRLAEPEARLTPKQDQFQLNMQGSVENKTGQFRIVSLEETLREKEPCLAKDSFLKASVVEKAVGIDKEQTFKVSHEELLVRQGLYDSILLVKEKDQLLACDSQELNLTYSPIKLTIEKPFYRSAIYATMDVTTITLRLGSDDAKAILPQDKCRVFLKNEKGEIIIEQDYPLLESLDKEIELAIPKLEPGEYLCRVEYKGHSAESALHVYAASPSEVRFNEHRNLVVNGKEVFPVGSFQNYWGQGLDGNEAINFNVRYSPAIDLSAKPDTAAEIEKNGELNRNVMFFPEPAGIWSHYGQPIGRKPLPPENAALIGKHVSQYQNLKGFWGWYLFDEPTPSRVLPKYADQVAATVKQSDPYHPCLISFNTSSQVTTYKNAFDICGLHPFLGFGYDDKGGKVVDTPILTIAKMVDSATQQIDNKRPVWVALSCTPYRNRGERRAADYGEMRCWAYLGIVHGAKGVYWNNCADYPTNWENLIGYPALSRELRAFAEVFLSPVEVKIEAAGKDAAKLHTQGKILGGSLYMIVVNPYPEAISAAIKIPGEYAGKGRIFELAAGQRKIAVKDGKVDLPMPAYGVRIFSSDHAAPNPAGPDTVAKLIKAEIQKQKNSGNLCYFARGVKVELSFKVENYSIEGKQSLVDGIMMANRKLAAPVGERWVEISFSGSETVSRVEVSWQLPENRQKDDKAYTFQAQYKDADGKFNDIKDAVNSEDWEPGKRILTRKITFTKVTAMGVKICLPASDKPDVSSQSLIPSEIQAFAE